MSIPEWAPLQYLWADSIDHENYHLDNVGDPKSADHNEDDAALEKMLDIYIEPALRFFDIFVKGEGSPADIPRAQWHEEHVGYRTSETWPPAGADTLSLFPHGLPEMCTRGGRLSNDAPAASEQGEWAFDPEDLIVPAAQSSWSFLFKYPDERATALHDDVATFDTETLDTGLDLAGPVDLWVRVSSTATTADVVAKLLDIDPDGSAHMIVRGQGEILEPDIE